MILGASFQLVFNNHVLINPSTLYNAVSVLACAKLCRFPCLSFFFNRPQHQCVLSNRLYEETHPDIKYKMGWKYYSFTGDVDECTAEFDNCHADATCTNTAGSFTCTCNAGYNGDGVSCTDVDECTAESDNCHADATCTNTVGSFTCTCNAGFDGNGITCTDVDECAAGFDNCHADATCTKTDGSFTCACNAGYHGDGVTCTDADECTAGSANCHADATCTNTDGSFTCACIAGYIGNGVTCTEIPPIYTSMTTENMILKVESVTKLNYTDATAACAVDGAHLFHLDSTAKINAWKQVHLAEYATLVFWLGLSDKDYAVNDFRWTDGTQYTGDNWVPGEPNNNYNLDDCAMISPAHNFKWRDMFCSDLLNYVCEIDQTV